MLNENILRRGVNIFLLKADKFHLWFIYIFFSLGAVASYAYIFSIYPQCMIVVLHNSLAQLLNSEAAEIFLFFHCIMCYFQTFVIITDTSGNFELLYTLLKHLPPPHPPAPHHYRLHYDSITVCTSPLFTQASSCPLSSLHMGSSAQDLAERCHMMPTCVWCFAGTPSAQEMLSAFFPPSCSAAESWALQLNPVTIPKHSSLIPTTARL